MPSTSSGAGLALQVVAVEDGGVHPNAPEFKMPRLDGDERDVLLGFLDWKRAAVLHTAEGLSDDQARWTPDGKLLPIAGIINHLAHVEARWIDGRYLLERRPPAEPDAEFATQRPLEELVDTYCERREWSNEVVRSAPSLEVACPGGQRPLPELNLRWVLLHLLEETSQHAGHADATRELLDGRRSTD